MHRLAPLAKRIASALLGREVSAGEVVTLPVHRVMAHDGTAPVIAQALQRHGIERLRLAHGTVFIFDHAYPPATEREAALQDEARAFARRHSIPVIEGAGIAHQVLPERGLLAPGTVFVGADSHSCTAGAFGVLGIGLGATDVAGVMASGKLWIELPESLRVRLSGQLRPGVSSHDLALSVVGRIGTAGALGKALEFVGPALRALDVGDRMKLSNHAVEMGALAGLVGLDERSRAYLAARGATLEWADRALADEQGLDADLEIDLGGVEPVVALPSRPDQTASLSSVACAVEVNQVFIGSCAGGRLEDLRAAAAVLRDKSVRSGVRLFVGPASREVLLAAMGDGTLGALLEAGATILPPGCGACLGRLGTLGPGQVAVATQNRNFVGRSGSSTARIYLASPTSAARAALTGLIGEEAQQCA